MNRERIESTGVYPFATSLHRLLRSCSVCPFTCGANRYNGEFGRCRSGSLPKIASCTIHHGEEPPISGTRGSGTIFFSGCPLSCSFCQNYPISQFGNGREVHIDELADCMLELQKKGAHNINLVTPTHFVPQVIESLVCAKRRGLFLPVVYNSSGYEKVETLRLLAGLVDVYLPDMKYGCVENARKYSNAPDYVSVNRAAVQEMYRQVGDLVYDENKTAIRGLIIRHLILPGGIAGTESVLDFIAELSPEIHVSLMGQYFPAHRSVCIPELNRKITPEEYREARGLLETYGLENGWIQSCNTTTRAFS
jgi:putative pyruvate formate lyase activating enzyme